jgi:hypothetical protein
MNCNKGTLVKYIDTSTGEYLPERYGRCDREIKCGYHLNPYKDGFSKKIWSEENLLLRNDAEKKSMSFRYSVFQKFRPVEKNEVQKLSCIPYEILKATRKGYEQNVFIQNLLQRVQFPFHVKDLEQVIKMYHLGTICKGYRAGAVTFPFIDINGDIRAIQAKQFDETNHTLSTDFLHSIYKRDCEQNNRPIPDWLSHYLENEKIVSCLFGEYLLNKYPTNPIALVEAPKTAIIGTLYFGLPDNPKNFLWLAVYNLSSLNIEKCKVLQGRKVCLFPDLNAYDNWSNKAKQFEKEMPGTVFKISDLLERKATDEEKAKGLDIADYLLRFDVKDFQKTEKVIEPLDILIDNIISIPTETITGPEFENMNIVWIKTNHSSYDVLFDKTGEPVQEMNNTVIKLASLFEKDFKPALLNGQKCLAHINN